MIMRMDKLTAQAILDAFTTVFDLLDHISAMRGAMERMEMYILAMVLMIGTALTLILFGMFCWLAARVCTAQDPSVLDEPIQPSAPMMVAGTPPTGGGKYSTPSVMPTAQQQTATTKTTSYQRKSPRTERQSSTVLVEGRNTTATPVATKAQIAGNFTVGGATTVATSAPPPVNM